MSFEEHARKVTILSQGINEGHGAEFPAEARPADIVYDIGWQIGFLQSQIERIQQKIFPPKMQSERPEDV